MSKKRRPSDGTSHRHLISNVAPPTSNDASGDYYYACTGNVPLRSFVVSRIYALSFQRLHDEWVVLGRPELDNAHWPKVPGHPGIPAGPHQFVDVSKYYEDKIFANVELDQRGEDAPKDRPMTEFIFTMVILVSIINADYAVLRHRRRRPVADEVAVQFLWSKHFMNLVREIAYYFSSERTICNRLGPHHCAGPLLWGEAYRTPLPSLVEAFVVQIQVFQNLFPGFGRHSTLCAGSESASQWRSPSISAFRAPAAPTPSVSSSGQLSPISSASSTFLATAPGSLFQYPLPVAAGEQTSVIREGTEWSDAAEEGRTGFRGPQSSSIGVGIQSSRRKGRYETQSTPSNPHQLQLPARRLMLTELPSEILTSLEDLFIAKVDPALRSDVPLELVAQYVDALPRPYRARFIDHLEEGGPAWRNGREAKRIGERTFWDLNGKRPEQGSRRWHAPFDHLAGGMPTIDFASLPAEASTEQQTTINRQLETSTGEQLASDSAFHTGEPTFEESGRQTRPLPHEDARSFSGSRPASIYSDHPAGRRREVGSASSGLNRPEMWDATVNSGSNLLPLALRPAIVSPTPTLAAPHASISGLPAYGTHFGVRTGLDADRISPFPSTAALMDGRLSPSDESQQKRSRTERNRLKMKAYHKRVMQQREALTNVLADLRIKVGAITSPRTETQQDHRGPLGVKGEGGEDTRYDGPHYPLSAGRGGQSDPSGLPTSDSLDPTSGASFSQLAVSAAAASTHRNRQKQESKARLRRQEIDQVYQLSLYADLALDELARSTGLGFGSRLPVLSGQDRSAPHDWSLRAESARDAASVQLGLDQRFIGQRARSSASDSLYPSSTASPAIADAIVQVLFQHREVWEALVSVEQRLFTEVFRIRQPTHSAFRSPTSSGSFDFSRMGQDQIDRAFRSVDSSNSSSSTIAANTTAERAETDDQRVIKTLIDRLATDDPDRLRRGPSAYSETVESPAQLTGLGTTGFTSNRPDRGSSTSAAIPRRLEDLGHLRVEPVAGPIPAALASTGGTESSRHPIGQVQQASASYYPSVPLHSQYHHQQPHPHQPQRYVPHLDLQRQFASASTDPGSVPPAKPQTSSSEMLVPSAGWNQTGLKSHPVRHPSTIGQLPAFGSYGAASTDQVVLATQDDRYRHMPSVELSTSASVRPPDGPDLGIPSPSELLHQQQMAGSSGPSGTMTGTGFQQLLSRDTGQQPGYVRTSSHHAALHGYIYPQVEPAQGSDPNALVGYRQP